MNKNKPSNGRVDTNGPKMTDLFQMYDKIPVNQCATFRNPTEGLWDNTALSNTYFFNCLKVNYMCGYSRNLDTREKLF